MGYKIEIDNVDFVIRVRVFSTRGDIYKWKKEQVFLAPFTLAK